MPSQMSEIREVCETANKSDTVCARDATSMLLDSRSIRSPCSRSVRGWEDCDCSTRTRGQTTVLRGQIVKQTFKRAWKAETITGFCRLRCSRDVDIPHHCLPSRSRSVECFSGSFTTRESILTFGIPRESICVLNLSSSSQGFRTNLIQHSCTRHPIRMESCGSSKIENK